MEWVLWWRRRKIKWVFPEWQGDSYNYWLILGLRTFKTNLWQMLDIWFIITVHLQLALLWLIPSQLLEWDWKSQIVVVSVHSFSDFHQNIYDFQSDKIGGGWRLFKCLCSCLCCVVLISTLTEKSVFKLVCNISIEISQRQRRVSHGSLTGLFYWGVNSVT